MKIFECQKCGQVLYFENTSCERCSHVVGYSPDEETVLTLIPDGDEIWRPIAAASRHYRFCANARYNACNWLVPVYPTDLDVSETLCVACQLNNVIPNLDVAAHVLHWRRLELAKHYLIHGLLRLKLPVVGKAADPTMGLAFNFVTDQGTVDGGAATTAATTGHLDGLITINLSEADDVERERRRTGLGEPFRTLLGHFRHEIGHYYWAQIVAGRGALEEFRQLFGDERQDYAESLKAYYLNGPAVGWQERYVTGYATAHPWEDFAETWAHYLHIVDTIDTAHAFGLALRPRGVPDKSLTTIVDFDPYGQRDFSRLMKPWLPLTLAVNSLNRSMGQPDLYPFVLGPEVYRKFEFVHRLIHDRRVEGDEDIDPPKRERAWKRWLSGVSTTITPRR